MLGRFAMAEELCASLQRDEVLLRETVGELQAQESAIGGLITIIQYMDEISPADKGRLLDILNTVLGYNHTVAEKIDTVLT